MDAELCIARLATNAPVIAAFFENVDDEQARWKPAAESWSMLEVVCHLYDEEREDFRARLDVLLHHEIEAAQPIEPEDWVTTRNYQAQDPQSALADFLAEREKSLAWLRGLDTPAWNRSLSISTGHTLHAGDMLASWVAHDFLHMRQLVELHYAYHARQAQPYAVAYAGPW